MEPFLRPTSLQQMRRFLAESGARLPPWSESDHVLEELVSLFHARRDDSAFFARLTPFLSALRESAARGESGLPTKDAEVLSQATVESLVEELRATLRSAPAGAPKSFLRSLIGERTAALMSLALLAAGVTGCSKSEPPPADPQPVALPPTLPVRPPSQRVDGPSAGSGPVAAGKPDQLVEMFKNKTPEETAKALEKAFDASTPAAPAPTPADMPKYKGVCI